MTAKLILTGKETYDSDYPTISLYDAEEAMIEFARKHVIAALKKASEKAETITQKAIFVEGFWDETTINKDSILNAYPLSNIV